MTTVSAWSWHRVEARGAGTRLEVGAGSDLHAVHHQLDTEPCRHGSDDLDVAVRVDAESVVDVVGDRAQSVSCRQDQQRHRVGSAGHREVGMLTGRRERAQRKNSQEVRGALRDHYCWFGWRRWRRDG